MTGTDYLLYRRCKALARLLLIGLGIGLIVYFGNFWIALGAYLLACGLRR